MSDKFNIKYNFPSGGVRYYLLTNSTGYPSAEFNYPGFSPEDQSILVVTEIINNSSDPGPRKG